MNSLSMLSLLLVAALAWRWLLVRHRTAGWERVWRFRSGPLTVELCRRAELARLGDDSLEFPQPREFRVLALRLGAIPLWSQREIVGLPAEAEARLAAIAAGEFDHLFDHRFRRAGRRSAPRLATRPR